MLPLFSAPIARLRPCGQFPFCVPLIPPVELTYAVADQYDTPPRVCWGEARTAFARACVGDGPTACAEVPAAHIGEPQRAGLASGTPDQSEMQSALHLPASPDASSAECVCQY